ncbi:MAG: short-chain dehydrogenase [Robiginitomaculum sp.]|nr:MAG: short-chain dehydrogenase [Robiginitomaculum sp.]
MGDDVKDLLDLSGHTVLVTGASGGIGAAIAQKLAQAGARLVLHYQTQAAPVQALVAALGGSVVQADLGSETQVERMMAELAGRGDVPDLLVNNAGIFQFGPIRDAGETVWKDTNAVNLNGVYALTKHFSNGVIMQRKGGAIVNIASISALDPAYGLSHYAASKAALLSYTCASATELGEHNIRVNAVSPGLIDRDGLADEWPEGVENWQNNAPLTRLGQGEDVANAVLFLLSHAASWISGSNLVVDGGMSTQNRW